MTIKEDLVKEDIDADRRCFLRRATMAAGGLGLAAASVPFVGYWLPSTDTEEAGAPVTVDLAAIQPLQQVTVVWRGKPIWVIRRTQTQLEDLPKLNDLLRDPLSIEDQQPADAKNIYRSIKPEFFVAVGICTHLGCIPNYRPDIGGISPEWLGGFYCPCHASKYDMAGRVYKGVPAPLNLEIPPYHFVNDHQIIVGEEEKRK